MAASMGLVDYKVIPKGSSWNVLHGAANHDAANSDYASKEAAFESDLP
jgi:hypothetical protein